MRLARIPPTLQLMSRTVTSPACPSMSLSLRESRFVVSVHRAVASSCAPAAGLASVGPAKVTMALPALPAGPPPAGPAPASAPPAAFPPPPPCCCCCCCCCSRSASACSTSGSPTGTVACNRTTSMGTGISTVSAWVPSAVSSVSDDCTVCAGKVRGAPAPPAPAPTPFMFPAADAALAAALSAFSLALATSLRRSSRSFRSAAICVPLCTASLDRPCASSRSTSLMRSVVKETRRPEKVRARRSGTPGVDTAPAATHRIDSPTVALPRRRGASSPDAAAADADAAAAAAAHAPSPA
jgi:hypothetical protein